MATPRNLHLDDRITGCRLGRGRFLAARMDAVKVPESVEFTDEALPRKPAGKILKNQLRKATAA